MDKRSVLVVDDDEGFRDTLKDILEERGYDVLCAGSCSEAMKTAREFMPMVALLDIRLPDGSGTALLADLKELNRDCICAMMTAFADLESALKALKWGAFQYLQKPVRPLELLNMLERAFETIQLKEQKKKLQAQLAHSQKMEAIGTLAGGVAHDFNNLLQAIMGYTQILLEEWDASSSESRKLKEIERAAHRASELTQRLLTFSRKIESRMQPVDLNQEVGNAEKLLRRTIPRMIDIEVRLEGPIRIIKADPTQIEQIVMNLAVNARDAMEEGGTLTIETKNVTLDEIFCTERIECVPGEYVLLKVADTGQGMDKETQDRIFDPFFTTKGVGKGTGLGLATVFGIVKGHGGHIFCESEPGRGTTFSIYLPAGEAQAEETDGTEVEEVLPSGTECVLVVDDEEILRDLAMQTLFKYGYRVLLAADGESALELYEQHREEVSLVILDLIMPGMGGKRCMEELLRRDSGLKIVIASGYAGDEAETGLLNAGAKGFVKKPYNINEVLKVIRQVLDETD
ncbi:MAG: response regulator [Deltaproteobacteria bacterium]|nr:response regulator [Deltaproteobacteria bacterium]